MKIGILTPVALMVAACATTSDSDQQAVFSHPEQYIGKEVGVCGYLAGTANLLANAADPNAGLSIQAGGFARSLTKLGERQRVCLSGTIIRIGCETGPMICTDAAFDYAIRVTRVTQIPR